MIQLTVSGLHIERAFYHRKNRVRMFLFFLPRPPFFRERTSLFLAFLLEIESLSLLKYSLELALGHFYT